MKPTVAAAAVLFLLLFLAFKASSQCVLSPVSLEQRVNLSYAIVQGKVVKKQTYIDNATGYVYTRNTISVNAWLKKHSSATEIEVLTLGGIFGDKATIASPALQLIENTEYILFLEGNNFKVEDKRFRIQRPTVMQTRVFSETQGAIKNEGNNYRELFSRNSLTETAYFSKITKLSRNRVLTPAGKEFTARKAVVPSLSNSRVNALDGFSPSTVNAGTILTGDRVTITGSGFGATPGTVSFKNGNDGGVTYITSSLTSDIISWSDASVTVKVPSDAGTGTIRVNGLTQMESSSVLNVGYSHISIEDDFWGFASATRQRYYLRNLNAVGGYTFLFNTTFNANAPAVAAFNRALDTWVCATGINFRTSGTTAAIAANDGVNVVTFNGSLPNGVLGQAISNFDASATGGCNGANTVWWASDIDVQYANVPFTGYTWEYGPTTPSGSEFDFESVTIHELGHAIGLGHRIAPGAVMHYALSNGSAVRTPNSQDISAANAKIAYSITPTCFNPPNSGSQMQLSGCTLPVTFISFSGERKDKSTDELFWEASHSNNNTGYGIERSADGENFKQIDFLPEANPTMAEQSYYYSDNSAGIYPWYYRLKQTDLDGKYTYSKVIFIKGDNNSNWRVFSSPDGGSINLYGNPVGEKAIQFSLLNASGQTIMNKPVTDAITTISASHLAKGVYYYKVIDNNNQVAISGSLLLGR